MSRHISHSEQIMFREAVAAHLGVKYTSDFAPMSPGGTFIDLGVDADPLRQPVYVMAYHPEDSDPEATRMYRTYDNVVQAIEDIPNWNWKDF